MLKRKNVHHGLAAVLLAFLFIHAPLASAQEGEDAPAEQQAEPSADDKLAAAGEQLSEEISALRDELAELKRTYSSAEGEEKGILFSQIRTKRKGLSKLLDQLVDHIEELEAAGQDATQPRSLIRELLTEVAADFKKSIVETEQRIAELREQRASASPEELESLDKEIEERATAVDHDLAAYFELTQLMDAQGLDPGGQLQFLDNNIQERADGLAGIVQYLTEERTSIPGIPPGASDEEKQAHAEQLAALTERIEAAASHLNATVAIMKERELDTAAYTQLLIESTGELTEDIFQTEVAFGLLQGWLESGKDWVIENGPRWLFKIIVFLLILAAFKFLAGITKRVVRRAVTTWKINLSQLLQEQIVSFAGKVVMFLGLLVALSQLGIQLGPLLAGLGIAGFIVGFALQDTLSNFAAGMMILVYRPYDVGDAVEAGGVMGTVKAMNLVSTTISTWDNQKLVVPNSKIWGDVIRNITAEPQRRVDMTFGIAYADDIDHAERVLWDIVKGHELVLAEPEPVVRLHTLGESSVDFVVRPWAKTSDYWAVYWDITRAVKKRFDAEGISIPFPQRDVHLIQEKAVQESASA
ncbi:MAG: mechanosensitive ion channel [Gammaproteobacteria bacterium]|jgi:small conductance mechanosensitive channel